MKNEKWIDALAGFVVFVVIVAILAAWPIGSYFEAQAYYRVTGKRVSTWDAMWLDLRVQEQTK